MRQDIIKQDKMAGLTDECRRLVVRHLPMAYAMAWRMKDYGACLDDLRQEACLGLCEAALRYDGNTDNSFAAYARHWCRKMLLLSIERNRAGDSQAENNLWDDDGEDEDLLRSGQRQRIDDAMRCLTPKEQQVVSLYYGLDCERHSLTEVASALGFSKARASALHYRALEKLEKALAERPLADYLTPWLE